jgi:Lecithin:cholesterol acyltransferase
LKGQMTTHSNKKAAVLDPGLNRKTVVISLLERILSTKLIEPSRHHYFTKKLTPRIVFYSVQYSEAMSKGKKKSNKHRSRESNPQRGSDRKSSEQTAAESTTRMEQEKTKAQEEETRDPSSCVSDLGDEDSVIGGDDGKMVPPSVVVSSHDTHSSDESIFDDDYNSGMYHGLRGRRYCLSTLRFFGLTIFLWCSQYVVSGSMKHFGVLEGDESGMMFDFDPSIVAQRVLPQLQENLNSMFNQTRNPLAATYYTRQSQRPGYQLAQQGAKVNYPVVMIPGFVTSGLEVWTSRECAKKYFRQRIWTGLDSARALFSDRHCWREHVALDPRSGLDPEGIRLRASEGFEAADYFMGKWIAFMSFRLFLKANGLMNIIFDS